MRWFRRKPRPSSDSPHVLRLAEPPSAIYAIGDIHGCLPLYEKLEAMLVADARQFSGSKLIVCLGDVVDRGPMTAQLIDRLIGPAPEGFQRLVLRGNHEEMMTQFLRAPSKHKQWLAYGGEETLRSYGLKPQTDAGFEADGPLLHEKLNIAIPPAHRSFLAGLPCALSVGDLRFAHAGYALEKPEEHQNREQLLWGPPGQVDAYTGSHRLVHGHVIVSQIEATGTRINLDLGAYETGRLAAMRFLPSNTSGKTFVAEFGESIMDFPLED